ncbi:M23 family metallopeptidase [Bacillus cereus]|uniref:M23 family metallopeptidase n=1 Tax=Bacillus cereus TaxID=1396 RepID=UPI00112498B3|nr:M23 family metallopeptidase [Bacillus cereus]QDD87446.1 hypothetical protein FORC087_663 [Bacillus cereus]
MPGTEVTAPGFYICVNPTNVNCKILQTSLHVYTASPLRFVWSSANPLKECGPNHMGARDIALHYYDPISNMLVNLTKVGDPVTAVESGKIVQLRRGWDPCGCNNYCNDANSIAIKSYSDGFITNYVHVNPLPGFNIGDPINIGQQIGTVDTSGDSCGPHVHLTRMDSKGNPTCNWLFETNMIFAPWLHSF